MAAGAGYYDAQGVWKYGETDNIGTLFSDFMNVAPTSISTQLVADRSRLTALETITNKPTVFVASSAAARDTKWGTPTTSSTQLALQNLGATTIRTDLGVVERYFALYNASTNPGGVSGAAGWFPIDGSAVFYGTATRSTTSGTDYLIGASGYAYTEAFDTLAWHNASTNPERITPNVAGLYRVTNVATYAANTANYRRAVINLNGALVTGSATLAVYAPATTAVAMVVCNGTTDYITCANYQDSAATLTVTSRVAVEFVRPLSA